MTSYIPKVLFIPALLLCLVMFFCIRSPYASLSISPALLELSLDRGRPSGHFLITNTGDESVRYRIMASHFTFEDNGNFKMIEPDENSLAEWIKFNPKELSLPPKSRQQVRFVVVPRGKLRDQVYWGAMELESLQPNVVKDSDKQGRVMKLSIIPAIVVPIFATKGNIKYGFEIKEVSTLSNERGVELKTTISNIGNGHLRLMGNYEVADLSGKVKMDGQFAHSYIMPKSTVNFTQALPDDLPQGTYTLNVHCTSKNIEKHASTEFIVQ